MRAGALVGVVLAGGEGKRMGPGPLKPLRLLAGRPMVAHVVERLRPQVMDLVVIANQPAAAFKALKVAVIADPPDVQRAARTDGRKLGPLAGILAGMEWAKAHHPHAG
ncbi:MAG: NTP transferase domain-containing protein, partial [Reyranella sp.]|nr:NTP transferase domain-containing protein [Reyranella sp.]